MNTPLSLNPSFLRVRSALLVLIAASLAPLVAAQTVWDGGGSDNKWETAANWNNDTAPTSDGTTAVQLAGTVNTGIDVTAPFTFQTLTVNSGAGAFTLSGSELSLNGTSPDNGTTIRNLSSQLLTINNDLKLTGGSGVYAASGDITLNGNINLNGQTIRFLTGGATRVVTLDGVISGTSAGFAYNGYNGAGTFYVNAANTYTATTSIWHATVVANNGSAFGTGAVTLGPNSAGTYNATLLTGQAVTIANNIRLTTNTQAGGTNNQTIGSQNTTGTSVFSGAVTLGSDSQAGAALTVTAAGASRVNFTGNLQRASGAAGSTDTLTKTGTGIVALSGANNTYLGATTVSAGTFLVNGVLSSGGAAVTVNSGATLGGYGTINRDVSLLSGSILEVGDNNAGVTGTLTFTGNLALAGGSTVKFDLGADAGGSDALYVNGSVTLGGLTFDITTLSGFGESVSYTLLTATGGITGDVSSITLTGSSLEDYTLATDGNSIVLVSSAIPEPGAAALLLGGGLFAWTLVSRLRRSLLS